LSAPKAATILKKRNALLRDTILFFLYRCCQYLAFPLLLFYLGFRVAKDRKYWKGLHERFGWLPPSFRQTPRETIWLHAISVGEVAACTSLVAELKRQCVFARIFVSVGTLAGREVAEQMLRARVEGIFYAPVDYCFAIRRVLRVLRPSVVAVLETEIWPNLWREARHSGAKLVIVNGRISDRALPKYRRLGWFFRPVLRLPDRMLVQSESYRQRFLELGALADSVSVGGNLKYDFAVEEAVCPAAVRELVASLQPEHIWVAASTMPRAEPDDPDEDAVVLEAFQRLAAKRPKLLLLLAPRRPGRFDSAEQELRQRGIDYVRRSSLGTAQELRLPGVLLIDTLGELAGVYRLADVVFLGGSLARRGGHNVLEPAFFGKPIIVGPNMQNFPDIAAEFRAEKGYCEIGSESELADAVDVLLHDEPLAKEIGEKARMLADRRRGASKRAAVEIARLLDCAVVRHVPSLAARLTLGTLGQLWQMGLASHRWYAGKKVHRLRSPVISVGALVMGGTGKTPLVRMLAHEIRAHNLKPAILTRGYRRRRAKNLTLAPGEGAPVSDTGDEAQLFVRDGHAAVGIGADRYAVGSSIENEFHPDVFLLDDGFQHWALHRDLNIVTVDSIDPLGGGHVFPLGRLREPQESIRRAHVVVIARGRPERDYRGIRELVRKYNPAAPVYAAILKPLHWVEIATGSTMALSELEGRKVVGFCGLGDPASFQRTLEDLHAEVVHFRGFRDHHRYSPQDITELAGMIKKSGACALVTTEKDVMNLPDGCERALAGTLLVFLKIRVELASQEVVGNWLTQVSG